MNTIDKYLIGKYDIEILTLPRTYVTVDVTQSSTVYVDILAPGFLTYNSVQPIVAQIFLLKENGAIDWVCNLDETARSGSFQLQPGNYRLVYRQKNLRSSSYTIDKDFRIYSNKTTTLNF